MSMATTADEIAETLRRAIESRDAELDRLREKNDWLRERLESAEAYILDLGRHVAEDFHRQNPDIRLQERYRPDADHESAEDQRDDARRDDPAKRPAATG